MGVRGGRVKGLGEARGWGQGWWGQGGGSGVVGSRGGGVKGWWGSRVAGVKVMGVRDDGCQGVVGV